MGNCPSVGESPGSSRSGSPTPNPEHKVGRRRHAMHNEKRGGESHQNYGFRSDYADKYNGDMSQSNGGGRSGKDLLKGHEMDELLKKVQAHNLELMKEDIKENDLNAFILDNLLLCVQLFDNFDKVQVEATKFKHEIEKQITEKLAPIVTDGAIHGERRCVLLHGMGHQMAQTYMYKDKVGKRKKVKTVKKDRAGADVGSSSDEDERTPEDKRTFNYEGILPLEFIVTWDNLEVYKQNEWEGLNEYVYSAAKGMAPIARFCFEEPNDDNKVPIGTVRLRCVDIPMSIRLGHDPVTGIPHPPTPEDTYYSRASDLDLTEKKSELSEVDTESDLHTEDDLESIQELQTLKVNKKGPNDSLIVRRIGNSQLLPPGRVAAMANAMSSAVAEPSWGNDAPRNRLISRSQPNLPEVIISPVSGSSAENSIAGRKQPPIPGPLPRENKSMSPRPVTPADIPKRLTKSLPKLTSKGAPKIGTLEDYSGIRSISSVMSEEIRHKWRQVELKQLSQFPNLSREHKASEPIHQSCYTPFKVEIDSDEDEFEKGKSDSEVSSSEYTEDEDDTESNPRERKTRFAKPEKKAAGNANDSDDESKFELRYYLNSSSVSAEFCSEFNKVGKQIGIPGQALSEAVVLGTTVRVSVPYPRGIGGVTKAKVNPTTQPMYKGKNEVLYTFTPSLHSKAWPQRPWAQIAWSEKVRPKGGSEILRWPHMHQVETLELAGCNVIPLGLRSPLSTQSDHVNQPFNWQVGFAKPETVLLNTFKAVHWRCYIMAALLFRAFIVPLGPLGIGLEHIRNVIYEMCNQNFHSWPEEKPGSQLSSLLEQLYHSLSHSIMYNFFVQDYNMLKNIPSQNTKKVQASLKPLLDNTAIHCIYAFRNLRPIREDFYPLPDFQQLYEILTAKEPGDLIRVSMMVFGATARSNDDGRSRRPVARGRSARGRAMESHMLQENEIVENEGLFTHKEHLQKEDKAIKAARHKREKFVKEQEKIEKERRRKEKEEKLKTALPIEHRSSIDLGKTVERHPDTKHLRLPIILRFFIRHFLLMASKSMEFLYHAQTAMYILHIENLCEILATVGGDGGMAREFRSETKKLRARMGAENMREYIRSKFPHLEERTEPLDEVSMLKLTTQSATNNWVLSENRQLPPLPAQGPSRPPSLRRIPKPETRIAKSLQSIPAAVQEDTNDNNNNIDPDAFEFEALDMKPIPRAHAYGKGFALRRTKFVQKPYFSQKPAFIQGPFYTRDSVISPLPIVYSKGLSNYAQYLQPKKLIIPEK